MHTTQPRRTVAPAVDMVSTAELKLHCRIEQDDNEDDALLASLISAAIGYLDGLSGISGRCLVNQTWQQGFSCWPGRGVLRLPFPDVSSVTLTYYDADNAEQTVSSPLYEITEDAISSQIRFLDSFTAPSLTSDRAFPITATMVAGYGATAASVPAPIRTAAMMLAAHMYEHREAVAADQMSEPPFAVSALVGPYRRNRI